MQLLKRFHRLKLAVVLPLFCIVTGCGASHARFTPTSDEAKTSLQAVLTAWRDGKPFGPIAATPPIQVGDSAWQAGQQVESFEIGEEKDEGDGTKQFVVSLKMKKPPGEQSIRYFVHGRDPVWVYREEDYKRMLNMDNNPVTNSPSGAGPRRSARRR